MRDVLVFGQARTGTTRIALLFKKDQVSPGVAEPLNEANPGTFSEKIDRVLYAPGDFSVTKVLSQQFLESTDIPSDLDRLCSAFKTHIYTTRTNSLEQYLSFLAARTTGVYNVAITDVLPKQSTFVVSKDTVNAYLRNIVMPAHIDAMYIDRFDPIIIEYEEQAALTTLEIKERYGLNLPRQKTIPYTTHRLYACNEKPRCIENLDEVLGWYSELVQTGEIRWAI